MSNRRLMLALAGTAAVLACFALGFGAHVRLGLGPCDAPPATGSRADLCRFLDDDGGYYLVVFLPPAIAALGLALALGRRSRRPLVVAVAIAVATVLAAAFALPAAFPA